MGICEAKCTVSLPRFKLSTHYIILRHEPNFCIAKNVKATCTHCW